MAFDTPSTPPHPSIQATDLNDLPTPSSRAASSLATRRSPPKASLDALPSVLDDDNALVPRRESFSEMFKHNPNPKGIVYTGLRLFKSYYGEVKVMTEDYYALLQENKEGITFKHVASAAAMEIAAMYCNSWKGSGNPDMPTEPPDFPRGQQLLTDLVHKVVTEMLAREGFRFNEEQMQKEARDGAKACLDHAANTYFGQRIKYSMDKYRRSLNPFLQPEGEPEPDSAVEEVTGVMAMGGDVPGRKKAEERDLKVEWEEYKALQGL